jgi:hypothetical protein
MIHPHRIHDAEVEAVRNELAEARKIESVLRAQIRDQLEEIARLRKLIPTEQIKSKRG